MAITKGLRFGAAMAGAALAVTGLAACSSQPGTSATDTVTLKFTRFFDDCEAKYKDVTDPAKATDECSTMTILINKFNAEHPKIKIESQVVQPTDFYKVLPAQISSGNAPDISIMHGSQIPRFAKAGVIQPLGDTLTKAGVDLKDFNQAATSNASFEDKQYALPWDLHTLLDHVNVDLFTKAGLVDGSGNPKLPTTAEELLADAKIMKDKTGAKFLGAQSSADLGTSWLLSSLVWQQGGNVTNGDGTQATVDTPEMKKAVDLLHTLTQDGYFDPTVKETNPDFLAGKTAVLINGTWAVGQFDAAVADKTASFSKYEALPMQSLFGTQASWADSHTLVLPKQKGTPNQAREDAKSTFLKFMYDNNQEWARTGHFPARTSAANSELVKSLPHRTEYAKAYDYAHIFPRAYNIGEFADSFKQDMLGAYTGAEPVDTAISNVQQKTSAALGKSN